MDLPQVSSHRMFAKICLADSYTDYFKHPCCSPLNVAPGNWQAFTFETLSTQVLCKAIHLMSICLKQKTENGLMKPKSCNSN